MSDIESFLDFYRNIHSDNPAFGDAARRLFIAHEARLKALTDARSKILPQLVLSRHKDAWTVAIAGDDATLEKIAQDVEQAEAELETVRIDIMEYLQLSDGQPKMETFMHSILLLRKKVRVAEDGFEHAKIAAIKAHPSLELAEIEKLPAVQAAKASLAKVKDEVGDKIADLETRRAKIVAILDKYNNR